MAGIDYITNAIQNHRYLTIKLSKHAYIEIPMLNLFKLEILGLYSILLSTRGKLCVKVGGT